MAIKRQRSRKENEKGDNNQKNKGKGKTNIEKWKEGWGKSSVSKVLATCRHEILSLIPKNSCEKVK